MLAALSHKPPSWLSYVKSLVLCLQEEFCVTCSLTHFVGLCHPVTFVCPKSETSSVDYNVKFDCLGLFEELGIDWGHFIVSFDNLCSIGTRLLVKKMYVKLLMTFGYLNIFILILKYLLKNACKYAFYNAWLIFDS